MGGIYFPDREVLSCDEVRHLPKTKDESRIHYFPNAGGMPRGKAVGPNAHFHLVTHDPGQLALYPHLLLSQVK